MVQMTVGDEQGVERRGPLGKCRRLGGGEAVIEEKAIPRNLHQHGQAADLARSAKERDLHEGPDGLTL
jgi:hypothetical protein